MCMLSLFLYSIVYIINFASFVEVWNNAVNIVDARLFMISKVIKTVDFSCELVELSGTLSSQSITNIALKIQYVREYAKAGMSPRIPRNVAQPICLYYVPRSKSLTPVLKGNY